MPDLSVNERARDILKAVADQSMGYQEALDKLRDSKLLQLGFAEIDIDRKKRTGTPEVIFCPSKSIEQITQIVQNLLLACPDECIILSRLNAERAEELSKIDSSFYYNSKAEIATLGPRPAVTDRGLYAAIVCAGTSDLNVAEEATEMLTILGHRTVTAHDIGVAALARLVNRLDMLEDAHIIIAVAGMEGALPSVLSGLVSTPIIAVPTSVGYGAANNGSTAMHAMLSGCSPGVAVSNIDNGMGAAIVAHRTLSKAYKAIEAESSMEAEYASSS